MKSLDSAYFTYCSVCPLESFAVVAIIISGSES